ncbi:hypothetical protein B0A48_08933 [Cryoendolithus antarcticus]|uniref:Uncharacterized protein n=1 Tax=Cryoendolithus antarcticus TaxID=1507870 RepID=A0A1V8T4W9_9PEZI|nr:hypothetical protein B0A48_08933 [Cryoendolithus antarcticus]
MRLTNTRPTRGLKNQQTRDMIAKSSPSGSLAVDTSFSRHRATSPKLLQGASDAQDSNDEERNAFAGSAAGHMKVNASRFGLPARPDAYRNMTAQTDVQTQGHSLDVHPYNKRIHGLRPSPLNLTDVSPSDRVVPIGIDISDSRVQRQAREPNTPTILITPAREDFAQCNTTAQAALLGIALPASSVYSGMPCTADFEKTPPVPPLPLFPMQGRMKPILEGTQTVIESIGAVIKDVTADAKSHKATLSVCTVFEEDDAGTRPAIASSNSIKRGRSRRLTSRSQLPTPRRSHGWWNFVTSPFSAGTNGHFWRSPALHEEESTPILWSASRMNDRGAAGRMSFDSDDMGFQESRSAGAGAQVDEHTRDLPTRSFTAPVTTRICSSRVDIYHIPSQGEAAAYYDSSRHFPSLVLDRSASSPLSALTDVCTCERHNHGASRSAGPEPTSPATSISASNYCGADADAAAPENQVVAHNKSLGARSPTFASPTRNELVPTTSARPTVTRDMTQLFTGSQASPLSETPVLQHAHLAAIMGPHSARGEPKAITLVSSRPPSPPGMPEVIDDSFLQTMVHPALKKSEPIVRERPVLHSRNDSFGLGITSSEKEVFFAPPPLSEKPRLGTDRFGQLKIMTDEDRAPREPFVRRYFWTLAGAVSLLLLMLIVLLITLVSQEHEDTAVQAQWLNLTSLPPLPTGVTTVAQPETSRQESACVAQSELWTCVATEATGKTLQPDFRFEIRFRNHTTSLLNTTGLSPDLSRRSGTVRARSFLQTRDAWASSLWASTPSPPSTDDQIFLGNTTDNTTAPHEGEETPFYLSLLDPTALNGLTKRQSDPYPYPYPTTGAMSNSSDHTNASTSAAHNIPKPVKRPNSQPLPETLYPYAQSQPLRLYNRDAPNEHYGFYTYFDRTMVISNLSDPDANLTIPRNSAPSSSPALCTWSQTRMHVQIWTRRSDPLLNSSSAPSVSNTTEVLPMTNGTGPSSLGVSAVNSTANALVQPGSFPYQATLTLDRHGGDAARKGVYCYSLDYEGKVSDNGWWVNEDRALGGNIVDAAEVPGNAGVSIGRREAADVGRGIDGGTGGCGCSWQNWK